MLTFKSSKHLLVLVTLWLVVAVLLVIPFLDKTAEDSDEILFAITVALYFIAAMLIWTIVDTKYTIDKNTLLYYSGPVRGKISIDTIRKIERRNKWYTGTLLKPALGKEGLVIYYDKFDDIFISPKNREEFIAALREINPDIEVV